MCYEYYKMSKTYKFWAFSKITFSVYNLLILDTSQQSTPFKYLKIFF